MQRGNFDVAENLLLPIQRQVVGELSHHHMSQQACGWDAFVDHLSERAEVLISISNYGELSCIPIMASRAAVSSYFLIDQF